MTSIANNENAMNVEKEDVILPPPENERDEAWILKMRQHLCPAEMIDADGNFDSMYFKPRNAENLVWGNGEVSLLKEGIELYGVCHWSEIRRKLLPEWDEVEIRIKACRLLGIQNVEKYVNWKGDERQIREEHEKNKKIGEAKGLWQYGLLLDEEHGDICLPEEDDAKENESQESVSKNMSLKPKA
jgi:hypothetical protein